MNYLKKQSNSNALVEKINQLISDFGITEVKKLFPQVFSPSDENFKQLTIAEAVNKFVQECPLADTTIKTYKKEAKCFLGYCEKELEKKGETSFEMALAPGFLIAFLNKYPNINTRNKKASFLRSVFNHSRPFVKDQHKMDLLLRKKGALQIIKPQDDIPRAFTSNQVSELLEMSRFSKLAMKNHAVIWTLLGSGIRADEVFFQIRDVLVDRQSIRIRPKGKKKTQEERLMTPVSFDVLLNYIEFTYGHLKNTMSHEKFANLYVFSSDGGQTPTSYDVLYESISGLIEKCKANGVINEGSKLTIHSLRHTFAIYALESGIDIYTISKLLGHASIKSTEIYLKLFDEQLKNAINKHTFANLELDYLKRKDKK